MNRLSISEGISWPERDRDRQICVLEAPSGCGEEGRTMKSVEMWVQAGDGGAWSKVVGMGMRAARGP